MEFQIATRLQIFQTPDHLNLHAEFWGQSSTRHTVILLHGAGQTRHSWVGTAARLSRAGYQVINYDARGHGDSDWAANGDYSLEAYARDLSSIIETLPYPPALVGASLGGLSALTAVGTCRTTLAASLVLVDIVPRVDQVGAKRLSGFMRAHLNGFESLQEAAQSIAFYYPHRPKSGSVDGLRKNLRQAEDGRWRWHWDPKLIGAPDDTRIGVIADSLLKLARKVSIPTLLVRGLLSDIVNDQGVDELKKSIVDLEVINLAEAGHMLVGDRNDTANDAIETFLGTRSAWTPSTIFKNGL